MGLWLLVAASGVGLLAWGLALVHRQYRRGHVTLRYLLSIVVGCLSLLTYAIASAVWPDVTRGLVTLLMLFPAFVAVLLVIRERQSRS